MLDMVPPLRKWFTSLTITDLIALVALIMSGYNTWYAQLRAPARDLRAASIHNELRSGKDTDLQVLSARIAIVNQGEVAETVLSEALSFGREAPSMSFARDSVIPTNAGNVLSIPPKDARIMDVSMAFRPSLLFKFRSIPAVFDGLKAHFGVSLFVLDPNGHQIETYLPLGEIWFKEDGTIAQTSGTRATASLLGRSSGAMTWKSTER